MSDKDINSDPGSQPDAGNEGRSARLFFGVIHHEMDDVAGALKDGANVNCVDVDSGLSPLHIAVGQNDLPLCRYLVENAGAAFFADAYGRWPSLIAAECRVDEELSDFICEAEMAFLQKKFGS